MRSPLRSPRPLVVLLASVALLLLAVCGPGWNPPPVTPELIQRGQARYPDATPMQLVRGRQLLVTACARCHGVPDPARQPEARWPRIVDRMGRKAKLAAAERKAVLRFVLLNRR
jgi:cytochrome c553